MPSLSSLVPAQAKLYAVAVVAALILGLSGYVWVQGKRIDSLKADVTRLEADKKNVLDANAEAKKTVDAVIAERDRAIRGCAAQVGGKDATITRLQMALATCTGGADNVHTRGQAGSSGQGQAGTAKAGDRVGASGDSARGDAVVGLLDGMLPCSGGGEAGVRAVQSTGPGSRAELPAGTVAYCLDRDDALRLYSNVSMACDWARAEHNKLVSMQTGSAK